MNSICCLLLTGFLHGLFFNPEDEDMFLQNAGLPSMDYMSLHTRRQNSLKISECRNNILHRNIADMNYTH
jgi:hypothetical protein